MLPLGRGVAVMVGMGLDVAVAVGGEVAVRVGETGVVGGIEVETTLPLQLEDTVSSTSARNTDPTNFFIAFFPF